MCKLCHFLLQINYYSLMSVLLLTITFWEQIKALLYFTLILGLLLPSPYHQHHHHHQHRYFLFNQTVFFQAGSTKSYCLNRTFYRLDVLPVTQPTMSKHWKVILFFTTKVYCFHIFKLDSAWCPSNDVIDICYVYLQICLWVSSSVHEREQE